MAVAAQRPPQPVHTLHPDHMPAHALASAKRDAADKLNRSLESSRALTLASLLEHPVEFVAATSSGLDDRLPYQPINVKGTPKVNGTPSSTAASPVASTSKAVHPSPSSSASTPSHTRAGGSSLFPPVDTSVTWARKYPVGAGLSNLGNTCFLNSTLQALLHTPPLVRYLESNAHPSGCKMAQQKGFCMVCAMKTLVRTSFTSGKRSYAPHTITKNLRLIAKHFRLGRQEDAHEFLRFCTDALQASALFGQSPKLDQKLKETTFVHQLFGGRLRSRVHCLACEHNSDTFDSFLDLSLDVGREAQSVQQALNVLTRKDKLTGSNKYKCEKCKKLVNAEKNFTISEAPVVLTIHLKRFTPTGRKITGLIKYPEVLNLGPAMADSRGGGNGPTYRLYSVIEHSGGGPHSGHYTAFVRAPSTGAWHDMNDDFVSPVGGQAALNSRNAYVLFYCRERGEALKDAIYCAPSSGAPIGTKRPRDSLGASVGVPVGEDAGSPALKRPRPSSAGDDGGATSSPPVSVKFPFVPPQQTSKGARPPEVLTASRMPASPLLSTASAATAASRGAPASDMPPPKHAGAGKGGVRLSTAGSLQGRQGGGSGAKAGHGGGAKKKKFKAFAGQYRPKTIEG
ncbi:hypothetical protein Rhopal_001122-T1 [Rhodotorula paludigena]|uniref:Ubiquitin carboxyl-terminal hydrolase n=1 Tax=Rhodotorula paludigena TaxID=86838 RepID=A0AAV5GFM6_9BASI|nr:hypothetical protein Rhopal_001122-T1 [Rhodotorula paludigena]